MTDIDVELIEYKAGRFISDLQFLVKPKSQADTSRKNGASPPKPVDLALIARAEALDIDNDQAEALQEEFGEPALKSGLDALEKRIASAFPEPLRDHHRYLKSLMPGEVKRAVAEQESAVARTDLRSPVSKEMQARRQTRWAEEWLRERRSMVIDEIASFSPEAQASLETELLTDMERRNIHPSIRKRLQTSGWQHKLVVTEMIRHYAQATHGEAWDKPSAEDLLDVATRVGSPAE